MDPPETKRVRTFRGIREDEASPALVELGPDGLFHVQNWFGPGEYIRLMRTCRWLYLQGRRRNDFWKKVYDVIFAQNCFLRVPCSVNMGFDYRCMACDKLMQAGGKYEHYGIHHPMQLKRPQQPMHCIDYYKYINGKYATSLWTQRKEYTKWKKDMETYCAELRKNIAIVEEKIAKNWDYMWLALKHDRRTACKLAWEISDKMEDLTNCAEASEYGADEDWSLLRSPKPDVRYRERYNKRLKLLAGRKVLFVDEYVRTDA